MLQQAPTIYPLKDFRTFFFGLDVVATMLEAAFGNFAQTAFCPETSQWRALGTESSSGAQRKAIRANKIDIRSLAWV